MIRRRLEPRCASTSVASFHVAMLILSLIKVEHARRPYTFLPGLIPPA